jgi:hypothetical protein
VPNQGGGFGNYSFVHVFNKGAEVVFRVLCVQPDPLASRKLNFDLDAWVIEVKDGQEVTRVFEKYKVHNSVMHKQHLILFSSDDCAIGKQIYFSLGAAQFLSVHPHFESQLV